MRKKLHAVRDFILPVIDFFYPPFRRLMNLQTFRYAASGGGNVLLGLTVYYLSYHYLLGERELNLGFYAFKPHVAALFISFCVTFPVGFFMSKYVVFTDSAMKGKVQLFRYFMICLFNLSLNYILLKIGVEYFQVYPVIVQICTTVIVVMFSYLAQRHFSFRAAEKAGEGL
ncbi:MAG TPA: GtrA family protein [Chitinophagaceae bacterium]|nr:GtrA family protein [Chitinophagaceae bacterium]